jgi:hypothetical protein
MKRKLLILSALLGVCVLGFNRPATASFTCSPSACAGGGECVCPPHTPAAGQVMDCASWYPDCHYF